MNLPLDTKVYILIPINHTEERPLTKELDLLSEKGFSRVYYDGEIIQIEISKSNLKKDAASFDQNRIFVLIDRFVVSQDEDNKNRISDSVSSAFNESHGECVVLPLDGELLYFNNRFELDGMVFWSQVIRCLIFNNPYGASFQNVKDMDDDRN